MRNVKPAALIAILILSFMVFGFVPIVKAGLIAFQDTFDPHGDFSLWDSTSNNSQGIASVVSVFPIEGTYHANFSLNGGGAFQWARADKTLTSSYRESVFRASIRFNGTLPSTDTLTQILWARNTSLLRNIYFLEVNATNYWRIRYFNATGGTEYLYTSGAVVVDTWYNIQLYHNVSETLGNITLTVNSSQIATIGGINTTYTGNTNHIRIGCETNTQAVNIETHFDDLEFTDETVIIESQPVLRDVAVNTTLRGNVCKIASYWNDELNISHIIIGHNNTGTFQNETAINAGGDSAFEWGNITLTLNATYERLQWKGWANNTDDDWATTPIFTIWNTTVQPDWTTSGIYFKNSTGDNVKLEGVFGFGVWLDSPCGWFSEIGTTVGSATGYRSYNITAVQQHVQALKMWGANIAFAYFWAQHWIDNLNTTLTGANATDRFRPSLIKTTKLLQDYGIQYNLRPYSPQISRIGGGGEGRISVPYPPTHDGSVFSDENDFIDFYLDFAHVMSNFSNVQFHGYDEPVIDQPTWFVVANNITLQLRGAGINHIFMIQWGYAGNVNWINTYVNAYPNGTRNVVFAPHIYRRHGTYGALDADPSYAFQKTYLNDTRKYWDARQLDVPIAVTAIGAWRTGAEAENEIISVNNSIHILDEWNIGWGVWRWFRTDTDWRIQNDEYAVQSPDDVGQNAIALMNDNPFVFNVGNETLSGEQYIYSNNTDWSAAWNGTHLNVTYTANCEVRVFWNVSNYPLNNTLRALHSNSTLLNAIDYYNATQNLIKLWSVGGGSWVIGYSVAAVGWSHTIMGVSNIGKIGGVEIAAIEKVNGVSA